MYFYKLRLIKLLTVGKYYLYRHIRLDKNEPFYIGIGLKPSKFSTVEGEYSRAYRKSNRSLYWNNIVNKTNYIVEILYESNELGEIKRKEIEFIKLYGRKDLNVGSLVNLTDGGDGAFGRRLSDISKMKIAQKNRLNYLNGKYPNLNRTGSTYYTEEILNKMRKPRNKTWNLSEESKRNHSLALKGRKTNKPGNARKQIDQFDLDGNFIKRWGYIGEAAKELSLSNVYIGQVCKGNKANLNNFIFKYCN